MMSETLIVIPARFGSTRFPGKPLHLIAGHSLLARVVDLARAATRGRPRTAIVVATDHAGIADHARVIGCEVVITSGSITTGSGRALAAAQRRAHAPDCVLNLQGDAPFVPAAAIRAVLDAMSVPGVDVATPVVRLAWPELDALRRHKQTAPFSGTTCLRANDGRALWFSKTILPAIRDEQSLRGRETLSPVYRHLGLYAYRHDALEAFEAAPPSGYEQLEGLEQLRLLEMGIRIQTIVVEKQQIAMSGIDTPEDAALAERLIAEHGDPWVGAQ